MTDHPIPRFLRPTLRRVLADDPHYPQYALISAARAAARNGQAPAPAPEPVDAVEGDADAQPIGPALDYLVARAAEVDTPEDLFRRLRWGGQLVYLAHEPQQVLAMQKACQDHGGFAIDHGCDSFRAWPLGLPLPTVPGLTPRHHFMIARRVCLISPGTVSDRFTFDVRLARRRPPESGYVVLKQVPPYYRIVQRLRERFPDASSDVLLARAEKLVERVFPVFLTREAAFLQLLQRDLPPEYRGRVPQVIGVKNGPDGLVHRMYMTWLRVGGHRLSQLEFARQSADLLRCLHDHVGVMHLDLRLDNMVITPDGVGFVDFGSAVRVGEDLKQSPMLRSLFDEMMSTSQIQVTLGRMKNTGRLTSDVILAAHGKVDRAVDLFYLALQVSRPTSNPDLVPLIHFDPDSDTARRIRLLTDAVLRPKNRARPAYISAKDLLTGLDRIAAESGLGK